MAVHEHGEQPVAEGGEFLVLFGVLGHEGEERGADFFEGDEGFGGWYGEWEFFEYGRFEALSAGGSGHVADGVFPEVFGAAQAAGETAERKRSAAKDDEFGGAECRFVFFQEADQSGFSVFQAWGDSGDEDISVGEFGAAVELFALNLFGHESGGWKRIHVKVSCYRALFDGDGGIKNEEVFGCAAFPPFRDLAF